MKVVLETPRLKMAQVSSGMVKKVWPAVEKSAPELALWMPWAAALDKRSFDRFARDREIGWSEGRSGAFWLLLAGEPVGGVEVGSFNELNCTASLGYWVRSDLAGRGLATEAARAAIGWSFETRSWLNRLELRAAPDNIASNRVAVKCGFSNEGLLRESGKGTNGFHDQNIYGLLRADWESLQ